MSEPIISIDLIVKQQIINYVDAQLPSLVEERVKKIKPSSVWMNELELAEYWRLYKDGKLTVASIRTWTKRAEDPLPCANMGELRRYHRDEVDKWAREEAERRKGNSKRKGKPKLELVEQAS